MLRADSAFPTSRIVEPFEGKGTIPGSGPPLVGKVGIVADDCAAAAVQGKIAPLISLTRIGKDTPLPIISIRPFRRSTTNSEWALLI